MKVKKRKIISIGLLLTFVLLVIIFWLSPYSTALFKSKSQFIQNSLNPSVYFEPGAEDLADSIALFLPVAINRVETAHGLPFEDSFKVYICNTQKSFNEFMASTSSYPIRGAAMLGDLFISPNAFNFFGVDTHKETITHELSHLHFAQRLGFFKVRQIPHWFGEGLADYVAGSGGEGIEESDAINFILNGKHFIPEEEGGIFSSLQGAFNGLTGRMFHKQVKMFVSYLAESDSAKFYSFVKKIQMGEPFSETFRYIMDSGIQDKWVLFITKLKVERKELN